MDAIREAMGLPAVDKVKNRKYKEDIIDPIENAIEEIETALQQVPEADGCQFTLTPYGTDTTNINEWLDGFLVIGLEGKFAETFIRIATNREAQKAKQEAATRRAKAMLAAKKESDK